MPNSPVSGQHCRYSVFEVNGKEKYRGSIKMSHYYPGTEVS